MKTFRALLAFVVLLALVGVGFLYSGIYDVSATKPDPKAVTWALETASEHSIERHSQGIAAPRLDDPGLVRTGIIHYQEMCVTCHGGPGDIPASEIGQGLNPTPPMLGEAAGDPPGQLFWVIKNGIKMTGMPAFGPTHTDEQIWALVAFVKKLPQYNAEKYRAELAAAEGAGHEHDDHDHDHEGAEGAAAKPGEPAAPQGATPAPAPPPQP